MSNKIEPKDIIISESIKIFEQVNNKINDLVGCSVKDFDLLNSNFKAYYSELEIISEASKSFIGFLVDINSNKEFKTYKNQKDITDIKLNDKINSFLSEIKTTRERTNYFILLINNLNQDLSTLKLLFTNLKFDPFFDIDLTKCHQLINSINNCLNHFEDNISKLHMLLDETIKFIDNGFINSLDLFYEGVDSIKHSYNYLDQLGSEAYNFTDSINELEKNRLTSTSEIITNLQFQDILRQKIEHVQEAHEEITNDLRTVQKKNTPLKPEELFKIRDITTLQSAQLIHSNQEYQGAVETILHKINELSTFLNQYHSIWNQFCKPEHAKIQIIKSKLSEQSKVLDSQCFLLSQISDKFESLVKSLSSQLDVISVDYCIDHLITNSFDELKQQFLSIRTHFEKSKKYNALLQIDKEFNKFDTGIEKLSFELKNYYGSNKENLLKTDIHIAEDLNKIKTFSKKNYLYINNQLIDKIDELINCKISIESNTIFDVKQVTYYQSFEKEINEIIKLLDNLLNQINFSKNKIDLKGLAHLEKSYTMDSERRIHDLITGKKVDKDSSNDKSDEVEFF